MTRPFIAGFLLLTVISITGCCVLAFDCGFESNPVELRLMRNGKNALFGPDAFLTQDDVKIFLVSASQELVERPMGFDSINQSILFDVSSQMVLEMKNIPSDTLTITLENISDGCCDEFLTMRVSRNGEVICVEECDEIIDIEI